MFLPRPEGQKLVEYALILVLVAIIVIATLNFSNLCGLITTAGGIAILLLIALLKPKIEGFLREILAPWV